MVRIIIKGGVWKNTEDEVLKAAIAKYGKNQWARISSLLVRKTPKQCKARWYEWLDPSIKKTEWSKEEDEKLLHLAKLMPTQWRTIAPIVGRTATQCLERYQKLLDEAEAKENEELGLAGPGGEAGPSADDVRRLRPGEIDPDPETKPARPDPIDMDEDEKEMLSEARARLANTQGKKAKRKARERQLEEARRLAVLQKKRELKAAGIIMRHKTKKKGMDYNADIPFEKKPAPGFYDTSEEQARITNAPVGQTLRRLENKRKPEAEEEERKKRQRRGKEGENAPQQTKFVPARDAQIQKLKEAESIGRRRKLVLPAAQVGEAELEEIVRIGHAGEEAKSLVAGGSEATESLLSDYEGLDKAKMAKTPRTAPQYDNVMAEARNLRNMTTAQTPLLGDENTPMHAAPDGGTGFEGATPRHQVAFTPNPLATPRTVGGDVPATPRTGATPFRTPMRDNLSINPEDSYSVIGDTPREQRMRMSSTKRALQAGFRSLPKPENNFELLVPEDEDEGQEGGVERHEDAAERDARLKRQKEEEERKALARRTQSVQRGLPRPPNVDVDKLLEKLNITDDSEASKLIHKELADLLQHDSVSYPVPGTSHPGNTRSSYVIPADEDMETAKADIQRELAIALGYPDASIDQLREGLSTIAGQEDLDDSSFWASIRPRLTFDASQRSWVEPTALSPEAQIEGLSAQLSESREIMAKEAQRAAKVEKKLGVTLGGYQARSKALIKRIVDGFDDLQRTKIEYESFSHLRANETATGPLRVAALKEEVEKLERREQMLQSRYAELESERREAEERIAALEDKLMAEAEALNEAALAEEEIGIYRIFVFTRNMLPRPLFSPLRCPGRERVQSRSWSGIKLAIYYHVSPGLMTGGSEPWAYLPGYHVSFCGSEHTLAALRRATASAAPRVSTTDVPIAAIAGGAAGGIFLAIAAVLLWHWWGWSIKRKEDEERQEAFAFLQLRENTRRNASTAMQQYTSYRPSFSSRDHKRKVKFASHGTPTANYATEKAPIDDAFVSEPKLKDLAEKYASMDEAELTAAIRTEVTRPPLACLSLSDNHQADISRGAIHSATTESLQTPSLAHKSSTVSSISMYSTQSGEEHQMRVPSSLIMAALGRLDPRRPLSATYRRSARHSATTASDDFNRLSQISAGSAYLQLPNDPSDVQVGLAK
ncbi:hypothetical protein NM688_g3033 [Phlebia brevispora]|uniref:Uncharacterized protein n=1 Tax=Phlebia brevispora TaxID=194682 RepID=A0ACC1T6M7_9APHY|nr:hypothetical protein NM688_g3033 [Phlebia brevispora]